jgi:hypothetical protein
VNVVSLSDGGMKLAEGEAAFDRLVRLYREGGSVTPAPASRLVLRDGQVLTGRPAPTTEAGGETLSWLHPALGKLSVPLKQVRSVVLAEGVPPNEGREDADRVLLLNGDTVRGIVTETTGQWLTVSPPSGDPVTLEWSAVRLVTLAELGSASPATPGWELELDDGSRLRATAASLEEGSEELKVKLAFGGDGSVALGSVRVIERMGGDGGGGWSLSLLPVSEVERHGYLTASRPPRVDPRPGGGAGGGSGGVMVGGKRYLRAIAMTAQTRMTWNVPAGYGRLRLGVAMDPSAVGGTASLWVWADGKVVKEIPAVKAVKEGGEPERVVVELGGAKSVAIEAGFGGSNGIGARVVVLDAMLGR